MRRAAILLAACAVERPTLPTPTPNVAAPLQLHGDAACTFAADLDYVDLRFRPGDPPYATAYGQGAEIVVPVGDAKQGALIEMSSSRSSVDAAPCRKWQFPPCRRGHPPYCSFRNASDRIGPRSPCRRARRPATLARFAGSKRRGSSSGSRCSTHRRGRLESRRTLHSRHRLAAQPRPIPGAARDCREMAPVDR
jgi:hypothetical protein